MEKKLENLTLKKLPFTILELLRMALRAPFSKPPAVNGPSRCARHHGKILLIHGKIMEFCFPIPVATLP